MQLPQFFGEFACAIVAKVEHLELLQLANLRRQAVELITGDIQHPQISVPEDRGGEGRQQIVVQANLAQRVAG